MPKKRFVVQYSKPQSTVHPSLSSTAASTSLSDRNDAPPSVNDLISSLRKSAVSSQAPNSPSVTTSHTLPPQIRNLLAQQETPAPRPRGRRQLFDANGRRVPPGPAPPRSWLEGSSSRNTPKSRDLDHVYPTSVDHLPGLRKSDGTSLQELCLRTIARNWEFMREFERNNLVDMPTRLRMLLLSYIAVYGPDDGVGYEGLRNLLIIPPIGDVVGDTIDTIFNPAIHNEGFFRLDLSGAMGNSISFKELTELVQKPETPPPSEDGLSWEETMSLSRSLSAPIPLLTHLSLSHPAPTVSWPRFLAFSKHVPTLTHLSLAHWPVPSLTPNAKTAVMQNKFGRDVQYGGTNYYSHSVDNDFREAAEVLRRLAKRLYGLEYLDLSGCTSWLQALRWTGETDVDRGIDWSTQWSKMATLIVHSGLELNAESEYWDVANFVQSYKEALATEDMLRWWMRRTKALGRRKTWIDVVKDDWMAYGGLWIGRIGESQDRADVERKRRLLDSLKRRSVDGEGQWRGPTSVEVGEEQTEAAVERLSVWDQ